MSAYSSSHYIGLFYIGDPVIQNTDRKLYGDIYHLGGSVLQKRLDAVIQNADRQLQLIMAFFRGFRKMGHCQHWESGSDLLKQDNKMDTHHRLKHVYWTSK